MTVCDSARFASPTIVSERGTPYAPAVPRVAIAASTGLAGFLRQRRQELGIGLRDVQTRSTEIGAQIPFSTLAKIEKGTVEPGLVRIGRLFQLYGVPLKVLDDLLDMEAFAKADESIETIERPDLRAKEIFSSGDIKRGLGILFAYRRAHPLGGSDSSLRQKVDITLALLLRSLGKSRLAEFVLDELQLHHPDPELRQFVLGTAANGDVDLGRSEIAHARLAAMPRHPGGVNERSMAGLRSALLGKLAAIASNYAEAIHHYQRAIEHHEQAGNTGAVLYLQSQIGRLRFKLGDHAQGLALIEQARAGNLAAGFRRPAEFDDLIKADCYLELNRVDEAATLATEVLKFAKKPADFALQLEAHHALWKVAVAKGDALNAGRHLSSALTLVVGIDDPSEKYDELRRILAERDGHAAPAGSGRGRKRQAALEPKKPTKYRHS